MSIEVIWANWLHLSTNIWLDCVRPRGAEDRSYGHPSLGLDKDLWEEVTKRLSAAARVRSYQGAET